MLTNITLEELKRLHRDHKLEVAENFGFISESTEGLLIEKFQQKQESKIAKIIYLHSVNGQEILEATEEILENANEDILAYLPLLEEEQICLIVKSPDKTLLFNEMTLDDLESSSVSTDEEKEFYMNLLDEEVSSDDACAYAVSSALLLSNVVAILYPKELEEQVAALKESNKERDVLFKTTAMFG